MHLVFFPLLEPLGFPDKWTTSFVNQSSIEEIAGGVPRNYVTSSICIHQMDITLNEVYPVLRPLWELAFKQCPVPKDTEKQPTKDDSVAKDDGSENDFDTIVQDLPDALQKGQVFHTTIVEVSRPFSDEYLDELGISNLFDEALDQVRHIQTSYAILKQQPVTLLTRHTLPPIIPIAKGVVFPAPLKPTFEYISPFLTGVETLYGKAPKTTLSESDLERFIHVLETFGNEGEAFASYGQLRNEAWCQYLQNGNYRLACLTIGVASEVMLDTLLLHLLWEEEMSPEKAAAIFDQPLKRRVLSEYRPRLAGEWSETGGGIVGKYIKNILYLRNRIAHAGYDPTKDEVDTALFTLTSLERYIGDRLTHPSNLNDWPRTATKWCGIDGLKKRGRLTQKLKELQNSKEEPDWTETFNRWRLHFSRHCGYIDRVPGRNPDSLNFFADIFPDQTIRWIVHDFETGMAALINDKFIDNKEQIKAVSKLAAELKNLRRNHLIRTQILIKELPDESIRLGFDWKPDFEVILEHPVYHSARPPVYAS